MDFLFIIIILIMSVVVHEVSHGFAALALGDPTAKLEGRLTLNPIKHLDPIGSLLVPLIGYISGGFIIGWAKPVPFNPYNLSNKRWGEAIVAIAGPVSNILLALVFSIIIRLAFSQNIGSVAFISLAIALVKINLVLAIFNLIPIPPLDGSKILFSILPFRFQGFRRALESYGIILVFIFLFFFWNFISPIAINFATFLIGQPI